MSANNILRAAQSADFKAGFNAALSHLKACFIAELQADALHRFENYDQEVETPETLLIANVRRAFNAAVDEVCRREDKLI